MSQDDSSERNVETGRREITRDSWFERVKTALGLKPAASIRADLADALDESDPDDGDGFTQEEKRILRNLLAARDIRVQDVMVPRGSVIGVSENAPLAELKALFSSAGHSRLPVYGETLDDPKGMIHIRDLFTRIDTLDPRQTLAGMDLMRPVLFAPGTKPALDLLLEMQRKRIHMALVIDEYGATDGLVSLEDLVEIIVGDIEDEHDIIEDLEIVRLPEGGIEISAQAGLDVVARLLDIEIDPPSEDHDIGTIGGYVTALASRVPGEGEVIEAPGGVLFTVLDGDSRRLKRLRVLPPKLDTGNAVASANSE
jgi:CBS domain containing-hemolysin-like protein